MKLSLDALKERAEAVASDELLGSISGGTENSCHDSSSNIVVQICEFLIDVINSTR